MRKPMLMGAACLVALALVACEKKDAEAPKAPEAVETKDAAKKDAAKKDAASKDAASKDAASKDAADSPERDDTGAASEAEPPKEDGEARQLTSKDFTELEPDGAETAGKPPTAEDLARYTADIEGDGPLRATISTTMGEFHCELFEEQVPVTVANFVGLSRGLKAWTNPKTKQAQVGIPLYQGILFHRVIPKFMIQGGDPLGRGTGNPGYSIPDEFDKSLRHDKPGLLSMANAGPNTGGSQFFITEVPTPHLDDKHAIFGACKEVDLVKKIARVKANRSRPVTPVKITKITISR